MLSVLGAPGFMARPLLLVEDEVHWLLIQEKPRKWTSEMLKSVFHVNGADKLAELIANLRPRCKLPDVSLDVIFQLRSRVLLTLQPLHYAIFYSSHSLLKKLLAIADSTGVTLLDDLPSADGYHGNVSPLFLAVLFADQDVVGLLRQRGAKLS